MYEILLSILSTLSFAYASLLITMNTTGCYTYLQRYILYCKFIQTSNSASQQNCNCSLYFCTSKQVHVHNIIYIALQHKVDKISATELSAKYCECSEFSVAPVFSHEN